MKKLVFGIVATVFFSFMGNAQTKGLKESYDANRPVFAKAMLQFVTDLKPSYVKGEAFDSFAKKVSDQKSISADGNAILKKAYGYLQAGNSDQEILKIENGVEIANASLNALKVKDQLTFEQYLFGKNYTSNAITGRGFWGSLWHAVAVAAEWVWDHAGEIINVYTQCCNAKLCCG